MAFPSFTGKGSQTRFHLFLFFLWRKLENGFYVRVEDLLVLTFTKNRPYIVSLRNIPFHRSGHVMPCGNFCAEYAETKTENLFSDSTRTYIIFEMMLTHQIIESLKCLLLPQRTPFYVQQGSWICLCNWKDWFEFKACVGQLLSKWLKY